MKLVIATDHNGVKEKEYIINKLKENYEIIDMSQDNTPTDDYPIFAFKVSEYISNNTKIDSLNSQLNYWKVKCNR